VAANSVIILNLSTNQGISGGDALKTLVFLTILAAVFVQDSQQAGSLVGLRTNQVRTVVVGNHPFAQLLARLLRQKEKRSR